MLLFLIAGYCCSLLAQDGVRIGEVYEIADATNRYTFTYTVNNVSLKIKQSYSHLYIQVLDLNTLKELKRSKKLRVPNGHSFQTIVYTHGKYYAFFTSAGFNYFQIKLFASEIDIANCTLDENLVMVLDMPDIGEFIISQPKNNGNIAVFGIQLKSSYEKRREEQLKISCALLGKNLDILHQHIVDLPYKGWQRLGFTASMNKEGLFHAVFKSQQQKKITYKEGVEDNSAYRANQKTELFLIDIISKTHKVVVNAEKNNYKNLTLSYDKKGNVSVLGTYTNHLDPWTNPQGVFIFNKKK